MPKIIFLSKRMYLFYCAKNQINREKMLSPKNKRRYLLVRFFKKSLNNNIKVRVVRYKYFDISIFVYNTYSIPL